MAVLEEIKGESEENVNNYNYKLLRKTNRTEIKVVKGLFYINLIVEGIKMVNNRKLVVTLVSTIGASFFVGSLYCFNKLSSGEEMIKLTDLENEEKAIKEDGNVSDNDSDSDDEEEEGDEDEDEEPRVDCTNKKVGFSLLPLYKFLPYGILGSFIGNSLASVVMWPLYGIEVPVEWNTTFYKEISFYVANTCIQNLGLVLVVDLFFKSKYLIYKKSENKTK